MSRRFSRSQRPPRRIRRHSFRGVSRRVRNTYGRNLRRVPKGIPGFVARVRKLLWAWWFWSLLGVGALYIHHWKLGILFGALAMVAHITIPRELPPIYGLDHQFAVESEEFLSSISGATGVPFVEGNSIELYNNGDEFYPAMLAAINNARASITIEAYIYWAGSIGHRFASALAAKSREGVIVKILLDALGSARIGEDILKILNDARCQIAWYHPIRWYNLARYNNRTHRKSLIIDGSLAFTGGAGIADHWLGHAEDPQHWRDMQISVKGPAVLALQAAFAQNWLPTTGEIVTGGPFYPPPVEAGDVAVQTVLSSPETGSSAVRIMYYLSIVCARKSVWIANPYFVPDQVAIDILVDARKRGVDVKVMVSGKHNDSRLARLNGSRLYGSLLRCGVEVYEYNHTMLHHKIMIVDGVWATVGTTNFDNRSFAHNAENNICFAATGCVAKLRESFLRDLGMCDQIMYEAWRRRPVWVKAAEGVVSLLQDQV